MSQARQLPARGSRSPLGRTVGVALIVVALLGVAAGVIAARTGGHQRTNSSVASSAATGVQSAGAPANVALPATGANAVPAPALTVYVVATLADQQKVTSDLASDPLYRGDAQVVVVAPGDEASVETLPSDFPNQRVSIVDLRN